VASPSLTATKGSGVDNDDRFGFASDSGVGAGDLRFYVSVGSGEEIVDLRLFFLLL
jgi:hypothetical protein